MEKHHVNLSEADKIHLEELLSKGSLKVKEFRRATGLMELHRGKTYGDVAQTLGVSRQSVSTWADRYASEGLQLLADKPRPGRPIGIDGASRAKLTALACSEAPDGHAQWTLRLLADKAVELGYCDHLSHNHAGVILKKMNSSHTSD